MFSCEVNYSGKRQLCYLLWYIFIHVIYLIARGRRGRDHMVVGFTANRGNNKITEHRAIFKRERQNSYVNKQTKSVINRKTGKTAMALTWYRHFQRNGGLNKILRRQTSRFHYG